MTKRFTAALNRFCLLHLLVIALVLLLPDPSLAPQSTLTDDAHPSRISVPKSCSKWWVGTESSVFVRFRRL